MKSSIAAIRPNSNIYGGRQVSGCTSSGSLKLHRKRVVHENLAKLVTLQKRGLPIGPDFTYITSTSTVLSTSTITAAVATTYVLS
jgi:hypothetical protein